MAVRGFEMNAIICSNCHTANRLGANYCVACGRKLQGQPGELPSDYGEPTTKPLNDTYISTLEAPPGTVAKSETEAEGTTLSLKSDGGRDASPARLCFGFRTDVGRLRKLNEDSYLVLDLSCNNRSTGRTLGLFVVADGMGGHDSGEIASGLFIQTFARHAAANLLVEMMSADEFAPDRLVAKLEEAVQAGNKAVYERAQQAGNDMGTTAVAALVIDNEAYVAHVGDSRAYLINAAGVRQITTDHSLVERLVAAGEITRHQARYHPHAHVIVRTIGDSPAVEIDRNYVRLLAGDALLLCSDGLSNMISEEGLRQVISGAKSPQVACDALVAAANDAGGEDNITVILVQREILA